MHILPIYYTTTNLKRKRKRVDTRKYESEMREHNKFLKRMKLPMLTLEEFVAYKHGKTTIKGRGGTIDQRTYTAKVKTSDAIGNGFVKETPIYKGNVVIGQAYNKGGLQVLSSVDAKDSATGKRR